MQSPIDLMIQVLNCQKGERIPFCPAIYEHKGFLIGKSPSEICRDPELLYQGLKKEWEIYRPDFLTVGVDVYNVEAEAVGCDVIYFDNSDDVPGVEKPIIANVDELAALSVPDPKTDGRMPIYLEAAARLHQELGDQVIVRGAISGPLSMASELVGAENFIVLTLKDPPFVRALLKFTSQCAAAFGKAFVEIGVDPIIFDSRAMPPLCSPSVFKDMVAPAYAAHLTPVLKAAGAKHIPLIIGGDTTAIVDDLIATGCTQLLCDFEGDRDTFMAASLEHGIPFRVNVDPRLLHLGPVEKIKDFTMTILNQCWGHPGFILGTGVAAYDCPIEHLMAVKQCLDADYKNYVPKTSAPIPSDTAGAIVADAAPSYDANLDPLLRAIADYIEEGEAEPVPALVQQALEAGIDAVEIVNTAMIPALGVIGDQFSRGEIFVPEMLISARAMKAGMAVVRPVLVQTGAKPIGEVLIGTVKGDIHDIGKNLVGMMLEGAGFAVTDLGVNVAIETFVEEAQRTGVRIIGMSALLTTTMNNMKLVVQAFEAAGLRDQVQVLVGGAPVTQEFCDQVGADFYGETAGETVHVARQALARLRERGVLEAA